LGRQPSQLSRSAAVYFALWVGAFPITAVVRVLVERLPSSAFRADRNLPQMVRDQPFNPFANDITSNSPRFNDPPAREYRFVGLKLHCSSLSSESSSAARTASARRSILLVPASGISGRNHTRRGCR